MAVASSQIWTPGDSPGAAPSGKYRFYIDSSGSLIQVDDAGNETVLIQNVEPVYAACYRNDTWQSLASDAQIEIIWDEIIREDGPPFKGGGGLDTVGIVHFEGWVEASFKVNLRNNENNRIMARAFLSLNWNRFDETMAIAYSRHRNYVNQLSCSGPPFLFKVQNGDIIRLHVEISYNDTTFGDTRNVVTIPGQTFLTLKTVPEA